MRLLTLITVALLEFRLSKAQFPLLNFGDRDFLMNLGKDGKKATKSSTKAETKTKTKKGGQASVSLIQLVGLGNTLPRHDHNLNSTTGQEPQKPLPGILSLFRPAYTADDATRKKGKHSKSSNSGFSSFLAMLNTTGTSSHKKARHHSSSDHHKSSKSQKHSKSSKKSKKNKSMKGGHGTYDSDRPSTTAAPTDLAFDSPADSPQVQAPSIQFNAQPTQAPAAASPNMPVARPVATTAPIAPVFGSPSDPSQTQGAPQSQLPTAAPNMALPAVAVTVAPTFSPTIAPRTLSPTTALPTISTTIRSCAPTTGPCVESASELAAAVAASTGGDTIAICATSDPIVTEAPINVALSDMKFCCLGESATRTCVFRSSGASNNMNVVGSSVRLQDLTFENGFSEDSVGGNIAVVGGGDHATDTGGNVFVQTDGTLTVLESTFAGGRGGNGGGGLYVLNARELSVADSVFENNTVSEQDSSGGGLYSALVSSDATYSQQIDVQRTTFEENTADLGGGFFVSQLGNLPRFNILQSTFTNNNARSAGAAGAIADSLDRLTFTMQFSFSSGNTARICEEILGFYDNSTAPECLDVGSSFP